MMTSENYYEKPRLVEYVEKRGEKIYEVWRDTSLSSKKIVREIWRAIHAKDQRNTP